MWQFIIGAGVGAAVSYFLDPDRGKRRRVIARDRLASVARQASEKTQQKARFTMNTTRGLSQKVGSKSSHGAEEFPNDATLAQHVESEIFRDDRFPKGAISINAENGVVVLRGELPSEGDIKALEERVRRVSNVLDVRNMMHTPGTPAPGAFPDVPEAARGGAPSPEADNATPAVDMRPVTEGGTTVPQGQDQAAQPNMMGDQQMPDGYAGPS